MYDIIILGGGPAGMTAGIYAGRAGMRTLIIEKLFVGGQAAKTYEIENYPGFVKIGGAELSLAFSRHAEHFKAEIIYDEAQKINADGDTKKVTLISGKQLEAKALVIATGAEPKTTGLPSELRYAGRGISYCATCDGALYKGRDVAVIGGGNTALEDALYLTGFASKVYLLHRRDTYRAGNSLIERLNQSSVIRIFNAKPLEFIGGETLSGLMYKDGAGEVQELKVGGVFVAVGQKPMSALGTSALAINENGYIVTDEYMSTNVKGVYCAGDVRQTVLRQVITAAADGAIAGEMASHYVRAL